MKKILLIILISNILFAKIFFIDTEHKFDLLLNNINNQKKQEHTIILNKIKFTHLLNSNLIKKKNYYKINLLNKDGELLNIEYLDQIIKKINKIIKPTLKKDIKIKKSQDLLITNNKENNQSLNNNLIIKEKKPFITKKKKPFIIKKKKPLIIKKKIQILEKKDFSALYNLLDTNDNQPIIKKKIIPKKKIEKTKKNINNKENYQNLTKNIQNIIKKIKKDKITKIETKKIMKDNKIIINNPFEENKPIILYKLNNKKYSQKELLNIFNNTKNIKTIVKIFISIRNIQTDDIYKLFYNRYKSIKNQLNINQKVICLNTLLLYQKDFERLKELSKIILNNQSKIYKFERLISYKILNLI